MVLDRSRFEILSPAGNPDKLRAAVEYGADAVYLSGRSYGLRAFSDNFNEEEMKSGISYAHEHGVKCYVSEKIRRIHAFIKLVVIKVQPGIMQDLLDLVVSRALRDHDLYGFRFERKKIHQLIIRKASQQIMRTCNIGAVKTIQFADYGKEELIRDKSFIIKLFRNVRRGITILDDNGYRAFSVCLDFILSGFNISLKAVKPLVLGDDIIIADINTADGKAEQQ